MQTFTDLVAAAAGASDQEKQQLKQALGWNQPSTATRNKLWSVIVWGAVIVLVGVFLVVGVGVYQKIESVKADWLLTMFTGILGFLTGLLVPSPVASRDNP
jgi:hypothetical protein